MRGVPGAGRHVCAGSGLAMLLVCAALGRPAEAGTRFHRDTYASSLDSQLKLSAEFFVPDTPRPLCLFLHGWHMTAAGSTLAGELGPLTNAYFVVNVDLRGRGNGTGIPDASGHELLDALDALDHARATWPETVQPGAGMYAVGGSGGGGNTLALVGKAPDLFTAAATWAGMSDYALWYQDDAEGRYRDEMEARGWIGGTPASNPDGYYSRGGIHVLGNVLTSLLVLHGKRDTSVPVHHAERYEQAARDLRKGNVQVVYNNAAHDSKDWPRILAHLRSAPPPPSLPPQGRLRLCSFLACRAFWLVPDSPSCVADVSYALDPRGRLKALSFTQEPGRLAAKSMRLRVFGPSPTVKVNMGAKPLPAVVVADREAYHDYRWDGQEGWTVVVTWDRISP